jgi:hypothetical protein
MDWLTDSLFLCSISNWCTVQKGLFNITHSTKSDVQNTISLRDPFPPADVAVSFRQPFHFRRKTLHHSTLFQLLHVCLNVSLYWELYEKIAVLFLIRASRAPDATPTLWSLDALKTFGWLAERAGGSADGVTYFQDLLTDSVETFQFFVGTDTASS